jgi:hypothetical protein
MSLRCPVADFEAREAARRAKIDEEAAQTTQPHFEFVERADDKYVSLAAWSKISWDQNRRRHSFRACAARVDKI